MTVRALWERPGRAPSRAAVRRVAPNLFRAPPAARGWRTWSTKKKVFVVGTAVTLPTLALVFYFATRETIYRKYIKDGTIIFPPAEAAAAAGEGLQVYSLARMVASEGGNRETKIARAHVAINDARALGWKLSDGRLDIKRLVTYHADSKDKKTGKVIKNWRNGYYGVQRGAGRYATGRDPKAVDFEVSKLVYGGAVKDPTGGAQKFLDVGGLASQTGVTRTFAQIDASWRQGGKFEPYHPPGTGDDFLVYRPARAA